MPYEVDTIIKRNNQFYYPQQLKENLLPLKKVKKSCLKIERTYPWNQLFIKIEMFDRRDDWVWYLEKIWDLKIVSSFIKHLKTQNKKNCNSKT